MYIRTGQIRETLQSLPIRLELICVQTITNGRDKMYYTNINDYEQLINKNKAQPTANSSGLFIVMALVMALLLMI
jgi:saccharopine dehydrogenase-like NADP-dependent oxidoreductase